MPSFLSVSEKNDERFTNQGNKDLIRDKEIPGATTRATAVLIMIFLS